MKQLQIIPQIHRCETFKEFYAEFNLSGKDLIFTETVIYENYIKSFKLDCPVVLKDNFGKGEPDDEMIDNISRELEKLDYERIIAIGGGSVIDIAKLLSVKDCFPVSKIIFNEVPIEKVKRLIIVPTTCGTGSEVTNGSIVLMKKNGLKTVVNHEDLPADYSVLIPEFISGLPYSIFITSSMDALAHATEALLTPSANEFTNSFALRACSLILDGFADILIKGQDYRKNLVGNFVTASCMGGVTVNNAGAGPVHALAYPLGEKYKVPHGESIYQFYVEVFNLYNHDKRDERMKKLIDTILQPMKKAGFDASEDDIFLKMGGFLEKVLPLKSLREYGMVEEDIIPFSNDVIAKERLMVNSYIPFTMEHAEAIYKRRY